MRAIDKEKISATPTALLHIDHCLGCLNCESICPSGVPFGKLIDDFRDQFSTSIKKSFFSEQLLNRAQNPGGIDRLSATVNHPVLKPLLHPLLRLSSKLAGITEPLTEAASAANIKPLYPASISVNSMAHQGAVSLFTGCTGKSLDATTLQSAITLLNQLGFDVHIAAQQYCCGAMHQHNGQLDIAATLSQHNADQFAHPSHRAILFFSPACGAQLLRHVTPQSTPTVEDMRSFIYTQLQRQPLHFAPTTQPIALHESCSQRNMLSLKSANTDLLQLIPDIEIIYSDQPALCCGAGGLQALNYPQQAKALLQAKLKSFDCSQTNILISDNIGCTAHMKSAITAYNPIIEILHPVSFLARQLVTTTQQGSDETF